MWRISNWILTYGMFASQPNTYRSHDGWQSPTPGADGIDDSDLDRWMWIDCGDVRWSKVLRINLTPVKGEGKNLVARWTEMVENRGRSITPTFKRTSNVTEDRLFAVNSIALPSERRIGNS